MEAIAVDVQVNDQLRQTTLDVDRCRAALEYVARLAGWQRAAFSIAIVGDAEMSRLHAEFLQDPATTDVMSFVLDEQPEQLEGELIVNGEMAARVAPEIGWQATDELLWYVVHGALHLAGWEDTTPQQRQAMFEEQSRVLQAAGYALDLALRGRGAAESYPRTS